MTTHDRDLAGVIRAHVASSRQTGYVAGGSGHMAHVDLGNFEIVVQTPVEKDGKPAIEVTYRYELWIDREFEMTPETMHLFKEVHRGRVIVQDGKVFPAREEQGPNDG